MREWDGAEYCDRAILDAAPVAVTVLDHSQPETTVVYANARFLSLTGYEHEDVVGASARVLTEPAQFSGLADTTELRLARSDGGSVRCRVHPVPLGDGETDHRLLFVEALEESDGLVPLVDVVEARWARLDTAGVDLSVQTDRRVRADRDRLGRLVEELCRTAIEDGDAWHVTVGELGDRTGFFVQDDGTGHTLESVGEGSETAPGARDLGGCADIADAQGWELTVTGHRTGGTRVELTGVELAE